MKKLILLPLLLLAFVIKAQNISTDWTIKIGIDSIGLNNGNRQI